MTMDAFEKTPTEYIRDFMRDKRQLHRLTGDRGIPASLNRGYRNEASEMYWRDLERAAWDGWRIAPRVWKAALRVNESLARRLHARWLNAQ